MDNFPLIAGVTHPEIPYLAQAVPHLEYDGEGFLDFPERKGWSKAKLLAGDFQQGKTKEETAAFLQSWLCIAFLMDICSANEVFQSTEPQAEPPLTKLQVVLSRGQILVEQSGTLVMSSKSLPNFMQYLKSVGMNGVVDDASRSSSEEVRHKAIRAWYGAAKEKYRREQAATHHYIGILLSKPAIDNFLAPIIQLSIQNIATSLAWAGSAVWTVDLHEESRINRSLTPIAMRLNRYLGRLLLDAGLCPSEIAMFASMWSPRLLYFVATIPRKVKLDHTACSEQFCTYSIVEERTYQTVHISDDCKCQHVDISTQTDGFFREARGPGHYPVVRILSEGDSGGKAEMEILDSAEYPYIAISHVWADGLGNPHRNSLPICQLLRLQKLADELQFEKSDNSVAAEGVEERVAIPTADILQPKLTGIGADNHCAGWGPEKQIADLNTNVREEAKESFTSSSISKPRSYPCHRLFWIDTLCVPLAPVERKLAVIGMAETYSKAQSVLVLDRELFSHHVRHTRGEIELDEVMELTTRMATAGWYRRLWTLQEGILAQQLHFQFQNRTVNIMDVNDFIHGRETCFGPAKEQRYRMFMWVGGLAIEASAFSFLPFVKYWQCKDHKGRRALWNSMQQRTASKSEDEAICLASMLGFDYDARKTILDGDIGHRMNRFLRSSQLQTIPETVLFARWPKMQVDGLRWAPHSFTRVATQDPNIKAFMVANHTAEGIIREQGLEIIATALELESTILPLHDRFFVHRKQVCDHLKSQWFDIMDSRHAKDQKAVPWSEIRARLQDKGANQDRKLEIVLLMKRFPGDQEYVTGILGLAFPREEREVIEARANPCTIHEGGESARRVRYLANVSVTPLSDRLETTKDENSAVQDRGTVGDTTTVKGEDLENFCRGSCEHKGNSHRRAVDEQGNAVAITTTGRLYTTNRWIVG